MISYTCKSCGGGLLPIENGNWKCPYCSSIWFDETVKHDEEEIVCRCFDVTKSFLEDEIKNNNLKTIEDVINYTKAGGGCGRCKGKIKEILEENLKNNKKLNLQRLK